MVNVCIYTILYVSICSFSFSGTFCHSLSQYLFILVLRISHSHNSNSQLLVLLFQTHSIMSGYHYVNKFSLVLEIRKHLSQAIPHYKIILDIPWCHYCNTHASLDTHNGSCEGLRLQLYLSLFLF